MKKSQKKKSGQTMVEYIIIVVVVAIAGLVLFGIFSDTIRKKMSGAVSSLDDDKGAEAQAAASEESAEWLKGLDETGQSN